MKKVRSENEAWVDWIASCDCDTIPELVAQCLEYATLTDQPEPKDLFICRPVVAVLIMELIKAANLPCEFKLTGDLAEEQYGIAEVWRCTTCPEDEL